MNFFSDNSELNNPHGVIPDPVENLNFVDSQNISRLIGFSFRTLITLSNL